MTDIDLEELEKLAAETLGDDAPVELPKKAEAEKPKAVQGISFDADRLAKDVAIDQNDLSGEFAKHASLYAYYASLARRAEYEADKLGHQEDLVYAKLDTDIRKKAAAENEKLTEAAIKNRILLDSRHQAIVQRKLDAELVANLAKEAAESFKQRRDMLIQMGSDAREEMRGELRMRAAVEADERRERVRAVLNAQN